METEAEERQRSSYETEQQVILLQAARFKSLFTNSYLTYSISFTHEIHKKLLTPI